ncbi:MATE family efflux transporter [Eubacterium sp. AB3007]|uniref:MATE family efflux transporter n=1 Tax=Eubacterium sp. AB3007 TaxID=1392487 RepID=UPI000AD1F497|nr:MATE family efflux transporter [Eubacterium sp. AB3007]
MSEKRELEIIEPKEQKKSPALSRNREPDANKMGTEPIGRLLAAMSWPAILSMMILALYNIVDSIFVARISTQALTAVSLVNPVQMLMVAVSVGSAVGVNSLIARRLGARRFREANQAASTSLRIGFWNFVLWAVFGAVFARPFMQMYTSDAQVLEYGVQYLRIVTTLSVFTMIDVQIEKVLQATGNMVAPMIISISGALTNVALDPILIFGLFGLPRLEVVGAAYATIIGQAVSLTVALFIFFRNKQEVTIQIRGYKRDWKVVRDIYAVGLPGMVMQSIGSIMLFGYNAIIAASATAVAVLGVYFKLQMFVFMPVFGMNQGAMPIMGYNYGARNKERLMETFKKGLIAAFVIMGAGLILFQAAPEILLKMFDADEEMLRLGVPALRLMSICFLPAAFGIMCSTLFQSTGHGMYSLFASLLRQLVGILPLAYLLYHSFGLTVSWASFPLAEIIGTIYAIIMLTYLYKTELNNL